MFFIFIVIFLIACVMYVTKTYNSAFQGEEKIQFIHVVQSSKIKIIEDVAFPL